MLAVKHKRFCFLSRFQYICSLIMANKPCILSNYFGSTAVMMFFDISNGKRDKISITGES